MEICIAAATCKRLQSISNYIHQRHQRQHPIFDFYSEIRNKNYSEDEFQIIADSLGKYITIIGFDSQAYDAPNDNDLCKLKYFPNLRKLIFSSEIFEYTNDANDDWFNRTVLSKHGNNRQIIIDSAFISDDDLQTIYNNWPFQELVLDFSNFESIYEDYYIQFNGDFLKTVYEIEAFSLDTCYGLNSLKFHNFCWNNYTTLKRLQFWLNGSSFEDKLEYILTIFRLENLEELAILDFSGFVYSSIDWTKFSMLKLKKFDLCVSINNANELIPKLAAINNLEYLSLHMSSINFTNIDCEQLNFTNLKYLNLNGIRLNSKHLIKLATQNQSLIEVHLSYTNELNDGLIKLIQISINLKRLKIYLYELLPVKIITDICNIQRAKINNVSMLEIKLSFENYNSDIRKIHDQFKNEFDKVKLHYSKWINVKYDDFFGKQF